MVAWVFFDGFKTFTLDGTFPVDFNTDEIKISLWDSATAPNVDLDVITADLASGVEMASGNGYTTGGEIITTPTVTESGGTITFNGDDVTW